MRYRYRRTHWGAQGFPWILFIILFFSFHHWIGFMISIGVLVVLSIIIQSIFARSYGASSLDATPMANQQPQPHEAPYQQPYQPYQQGYQPMPMTYQEGEQQYQYPQPEPQYEQPQVQYPEELPPIEQ